MNSLSSDLQSLIASSISIKGYLEVIKVLKKYDILNLIDVEITDYLKEEIRGIYARIHKIVDEDKEHFNII